MANSEQYGIALLRILAIAVAVLLVGTIVVTFAFLSSGNESSLLPPWQLVVAEVTCVIILLFLSSYFLKLKDDSSILKAAVLIATALTIVVGAYWGVGQTWSPLSLAGKAVATFGTLAYPILISAGAIVMMRKRSVQVTIIWVVSLTLSLLLAVPMILVGGVLGCLLTGDCF